MPCWTIQESRAEFGANTDRSLFVRALQTMGYQVSNVGGVIYFTDGTRSGGRMETDNTLVMQGDLTLNPFKRAYSVEVVKATSARFGWKVSEKSPTAFQVTRRA